MKAKGRTVVVALVTVFALSVVSVSAASATSLPEFKPSTKQAFTSKISPFFLETKRREEWLECTAGKTVGEIVNATQVGEVVVTLTGCRIPGLNTTCHTSGKSSGEVVTNALKGELGETGTTVVLGLEPEKAGEAVAVYECSIDKITVKGGVIGKIEPIGKPETTFKQVWSQAGGEQTYKSFEGSSTKKVRSLHLEWAINSGTVEEAGIKGIEELTFAPKEVEIT